MTTIDFMHDSDCFRSHTALRESIFYDRKLASSNPESIVSMVQHARPKKSTMSLINFKSDKSVIVAIQNDVKFINMIMNCRKQSSPIAHIFVESNQYISCIIKNANGYPIIFIRIPIDNVYAYAQNTRNIYEFPIQKLLEKECVKFTRNSTYTIIFRYDGQNVSFSYELYDGDMEPSRIDISNISTNNQSVINNLLNTENEISLAAISTGALKIVNPHKQLQISSSLSNTNDNNLLAFINMNVLILREVIDLANVLKFELKTQAKPNNYFTVDNVNMNFVSETSNIKNVKYVCSKTDSLIWTDIGPSKYEMLPFSPLFKVNYSKSITANDKLYYIFTSYLNNYMFVKLITSVDVIDTTKMNTLSKLFPKEYQILECYVCVKTE